MKPKFSAFHGDQKIKDKYVARMKAHIEADELIQGTGYSGVKGCAVGCTLNKYSHFAYEEELGIPFTIAILEDDIFESLSVENSKSFPLEFLEAVPVGADLSLVYNKMEIFDIEYVMSKIIMDSDKQICSDLILLHKNVIDGIEIEEHSWGKIKDRSYRSYRSDLADRSDRSDLAYLADLADLADRAYRAYLADRAYLAYLADRADLAYRADLADARREKFIELINNCK